VSAGLWSIVEAHGPKKISADSDAVGYGVALLAWILSSGTFIAAKAAADEMPPWTFCFFRVLIASLVLLPLVRRHFPAMRAFLRQHWLEAMAIGALGLGINQGLLFTALHYTSAVTTGVIFSTSPLITMVLARFVLQEPLGRWQAVGTLIAFCGIVVITVRGSLSVLLGLDISAGDLIVVVAAFAISSYTVLLKRAKFKLERLPLLVILMSSAAIVVFPAFLFELWNGEHANLAWKGYLALAYAAIPAGGLMYLLYNWSIDLLGAGRAQSLLYSQMVFTAILAWLILGEEIVWYQYVGAGLIVIGIALVMLLKPKPAAISAQ
jgi:drug/metabolite transporter (DMT)-like permease